jgi:chemotaxis methyl-accepting protein methylase
MDERPGDAIYRGNLAKLLEKVREERGLDLTQYRVRYLERRISARLHMLNLHTYRQYVAYLDEHPDEYATLLDALTINVTQFFRDDSVFDLFRSDIIPSLMAQKAARHQRMIRVWSAGCATGEEPYSIAMAFKSQIERSKSGIDFLLLVIGIDRQALQVARKAEYPYSQLAQLSKPDKVKYVEVHGDRFKMKPEITRHVKFEYLNLFEDKPIHVVDVIFCRNVFIYFNREEQERMLDVFWGALSKGGYLVLGRSERVLPNVAKRWELISGRERIYRKPLRVP